MATLPQWVQLVSTSVWHYWRCRAAAGRTAPGAAARGARRDPLRRTVPVHRTATTSCPTWRSARTAGSPPGRRRGHRAPRRAGSPRPTSRRRTHPATDDAGPTAPPCGERRTCRLSRTWGVGIVVVAVGAGRVVDRPHQGAGSLCVPAGLRAPAHRQAGRDQPAVHRRRRHLLRLLPGRGGRIQVRTNSHRRDRRPDSSAMAARCSCSVEPAAGALAEGHRHGPGPQDLPGREDRLRDSQHDGGLPARLRRSRRLLAAGRQQQATADAGAGDGGGEERPGAGGIRGGPVPRVRPGFRARAAVGRQPRIAEDMGKYVNSFSWRGDPAR